MRENERKDIHQQREHNYDVEKKDNNDDGKKENKRYASNCDDGKRENKRCMMLAINNMEKKREKLERSLP